MIPQFEFVDLPTGEYDPHTFVVKIPVGVSSKSALLAVFARAGKFPGYFGGNWDAFLDCLRDFEWIQEKKIVIAHDDLPLISVPTECRTYLEILRDAVDDWSRPSSRPHVEKGFPAHELRVIFPAHVQSTVSELLS